MRLDGALLTRIKRVAAREGRSSTNLVEKILTDALVRRGKTEKADDDSVFG